MKMGWPSATGRILALGALAVAVAASSVRAQQSSADCRCVDRDGDQIERCTCFRMPRVEGLIRGLSFAGARPRLGISVSTSQGAELDAQGARVTQVLEDGPADDAGLREDDLITRIDGRSLFDPLPGDAEDDFDLDESIPVQRLLAIARQLEPGQEAEIEYLRDGEARSTSVEAGDLWGSWGRSFSLITPEFDAERLRLQLRDLTDGARAFELRFDGLREDRLRDRELSVRFDGLERGGAVLLRDGAGGSMFLNRFGPARDGLEMIELKPGLGEYFGIAEGVLVTDVAEDSSLGLEPGDVIVRVGEREVSTPDRVRWILRSYADDEDVTFQVRRDGRDMGVTGRLGN